jgi:hypothetical protein
MGITKFNNMKNNNIILPSNKKFGIFFSLVFLIAALFFWFTQNNLFFYLFLFLAFIFLTLSFTKPNSLKFLNQLWMNFGILLGKFVSPIVLGLIYFLIFTPISIIMKLFGRDELKLKIKTKKTHWLRRTETKLDSDSFTNQF